MFRRDIDSKLSSLEKDQQDLLSSAITKLEKVKRIQAKRIALMESRLDKVETHGIPPAPAVVATASAHSTASTASSGGAVVKTSYTIPQAEFDRACVLLDEAEVRIKQADALFRMRDIPVSSTQHYAPTVGPAVAGAPVVGAPVVGTGTA
jgi:hypothetical protein